MTPRDFMNIPEQAPDMPFTACVYKDDPLARISDAEFKRRFPNIKRVIVQPMPRESKS